MHANRAGGNEGVSASVLGNGIYTFPQASQLIRAKPQRIAAWFRGRANGRGPVFRSTYAGSGRSEVVRTISFLDLIEALVSSQLRKHGVSLIAARKAHKQLADLLKTLHPFAHEGLYTDGKRVFVRIAKESHDERVIDAICRQDVFPAVLLPYLKRIEFGKQTRLAERWRIIDGMVVDPARRSGKPILESCGMSASILARSYESNLMDVELVADWYGVAPKDVELAVRFEEQFPRKVA